MGKPDEGAGEQPEVTEKYAAARAEQEADAAEVEQGSSSKPGEKKALESEEQPKPVEDATQLVPMGPLRQSYWDIFRQFAWLGWAAFGGPSAHIGLFQKVFVERRKWLSAGLFLELLALCQFMPGPSSTQQAYALGVTQRGVLGGLLSGMLFQYPGLIIASIVGVGAAKFLAHPAPWLVGLTSGGLAAVGVALVASAAKNLTKSTCKDRLTLCLNIAAAVITFYYPTTWIFPVVLAAGGVITLVARRKKVLPAEDEPVEHLGVGRIMGAILVALFAAVLIASIVARANTKYEDAKVLHWWEAFYRIGSLIFGGGQVVLPMLDSAIVAKGWMTPAEYFTGIALIQAMPGPLFNISAYIGAVIAARANIFQLVGIIVCFVGINAPGLLLLYGLLPWWRSFRRFPIYRRALPGLNATAVGLIVGAVFTLGIKIYKNSPFPSTSLCIGIIGFTLVDFLNVPAPLAVLAGGVLGIIGWAAGMK